MGDELGVDKIIAFATSALRSAKNAQVFIDKVKKMTGLEIKIISGEQEADYISRGIFANLKLPEQRMALVDIGGGSTEITLSQGTQILQQQSFALGANRLQQLFIQQLDLKGNSEARQVDLKLRKFIRNELRPLVSEIKKRTYAICYWYQWHN